mmetsp:Transcript_20807/g.73444  ORF Transcript_20807/g.73444 Transcript_20807/m.73444 type:complete len:395 (-) Transcript_20807:138-1322(-)
MNRSFAARRRSACVRNAPAFELKRRREEAADSGSDPEDNDAAGAFVDRGAPAASHRRTPSGSGILRVLASRASSRVPPGGDAERIGSGDLNLDLVLEAKMAAGARLPFKSNAYVGTFRYAPTSGISALEGLLQPSTGRVADAVAVPLPGWAKRNAVVGTLSHAPPSSAAFDRLRGAGHHRSPPSSPHSGSSGGLSGSSFESPVSRTGGAAAPARAQAQAQATARAALAARRPPALHLARGGAGGASGDAGAEADLLAAAASEAARSPKTAAPPPSSSSSSEAVLSTPARPRGASSPPSPASARRRERRQIRAWASRMGAALDAREGHLPTWGSASAPSRGAASPSSPASASPPFAPSSASASASAATTRPGGGTGGGGTSRSSPRRSRRRARRR